MTSTLRFWILFAVVLLLLIWVVKKYLGRIILIFVFLFVVFFVYKWLNPTGAQTLLTWFKTAPIAMTNYLNREILKKDITLPVPELTTSEVIAEPPQDSKQEEEKLSWFARIFKKDKKSESLSSQESSSGREIPNKEALDGVLSGAKVMEVATGVVIVPEMPDETLISVQHSGVIVTGERLSAGIVPEAPLEEEEIIYLPSNPKPAPEAKKPATSSSPGLSAEDIREAQEIFGG